MIKTSHFIQWGLVSLIILASFLLMLNASLKESAVMDELAHIPAGYGYVRYLDYRLNPEHPPLLKALAAIPLLFQSFGSAQDKLNFPINSSGWQKDVNGQWIVGTQFLYESGNDADKIIQWSRLGPMLLTLLLIIFIYIWAKELMGRWWALIPTFLFALSPTVLAHGHYVTTDIGAAFGIFIATYYFIKFILKPSRRHLIFAALTFGIAQLMKFSAVLLIPFFVFLIVVFCIWKIKNEQQKIITVVYRYILPLIAIFAIGYLIVYIVYFVFTINYPVEKQKADTEFILTSFAKGPDTNWESCKLSSKVELSRRLRCVADINIWMSQNKILRPIGQYLLGVLMVLQRSSGGNTAYFLGEVSASGWWYYFPVVFVLKEPIPSLILILFAFILGIWRIIKGFKFQISSVFKKFSDYLGTHVAEFSMLVFVIFYWLYSVKSPLNIGIRHILPTMPFVYILAISSLKKWIDGKVIIFSNSWKRLFALIVNFLKVSSKGILVGILIIWYLIETLLTAPYFLSYFNQFGGGINKGYQYVTDSNYDWGQDLKRLAQWANKENINKIAIDYFGGGNPKYYLGNKVEYWNSAEGNPEQSRRIKWLAISINTLQGALGELHLGQSRNPEDEYQWLQKIKNIYKPDAKAGTSIFIYKL